MEREENDRARLRYSRHSGLPDRIVPESATLGFESGLLFIATCSALAELDSGTLFGDVGSARD
jgi:hypothetical protein